MRCSCRARLSLATVDEAANAVEATSAGAITHSAKNQRDRGARKACSDRNNLLLPFFSSTAKLDDGSTVVFVATRSRVGDSSNAQLVQQQNAALLQRSASGEVAAYLNEAKRKAKIVKNTKVFEY